MKKTISRIQSRFPKCNNRSIEKALILSYMRSKSISFDNSAVIYSFLKDEGSDYELIADYIDDNDVGVKRFPTNLQ